MRPEEVAELVARHFTSFYWLEDPTAAIAEGIKLCCCVQAMDVFAAFYREELAKHLLANFGKHMRVENTVATCISKAFGSDLVRKVKEMLKDIEINKQHADISKFVSKFVPNSSFTNCNYRKGFPRH